MKEIQIRNPNKYVGINLLGHPTDEVFDLIEEAMKTERIVKRPQAVWVDNIERCRINPVEFLRMKNQSIEQSRTELFGGIAFKYTRTFTEDPEEALGEALRLCDATDVITTSGVRTGTAPTIQKIRAIKHADESKRVAIASGVSIENIESFDGIADAVLVASSVEIRPYSGAFNPKKLEAIINNAHSLGAY